MTRYGVIADLHGNEEALIACLARLRGEGLDRVVCLGDLVGFNAEPNECVKRVAQEGVLCAAGNHDLIALGQLGFEQCADEVIFALRQTRRDLREQTRRFLGALPRTLCCEAGVLAVHGGLSDVSQYLRSPSELQATAACVARSFPEVRLLLFAHTHEPRIYRIADGSVLEQAPEGEVALASVGLSLVNPGSVDASRRPETGRNPVRWAEFLVLDTDAWSVRFLRAPYNHVVAECRAVSAGYRITSISARVYRGWRLLHQASLAVRRRLAWP